LAERPFVVREPGGGHQGLSGFDLCSWGTILSFCWRKYTTDKVSNQISNEG